MVCRFSSLITLAGLLVVASGHGSMLTLSAQSRGCPQEVFELTSRSQHPSDWTPAEQLIDKLTSEFQGTIFIPSTVTVEMGTLRNVGIGPCVTLKGARGGLDPGALIISTGLTPWKDDGPVFTISGQHVRIEGLRFRGPVTTDLRGSLPDEGLSIKAFEVKDGATATIDNNTFEFWSVAVIVIRHLEQPDLCPDIAPPVSITRNYFNRNADENSGYGVGVSAGCARIEGNLFNKNRHSVSSFGGEDHRQSYLARYNYVLQGGFTVCGDLFCHWNQHFDVHGSISGYGGEAGEYFDISSNTIRGEQGYYQTQTRPAFMLRGKPTHGAYFHHNVVVHDDASAAVRLKKPGAQCLDYDPQPPTAWQLCNLYVEDNRYDTDRINDLAVGDFDGDGIDDLFLANGTAWWYSSAGVTEWRFLRSSTLRVRDIRFGDFTGDGRTDVLVASGPNWFVSSGGWGAAMWWRGDGTRLLDCAFGDFDGDGDTDALRADGSTWSVAANGNGPWLFRRNDSVRAADLRVADFTNDDNDEVFWIADDTWSLWYPSTNLVNRDHRKPVSDSDLPLLVIADFDGDGQADLAKTDLFGWSWLPSGAMSWSRLRWNDGQTEYNDIRRAVFGRFTVGDESADAVRYATSDFPAASRFGFALWTRTHNSFIPWSLDWVEMR